MKDQNEGAEANLAHERQTTSPSATQADAANEDFSYGCRLLGEDGMERRQLSPKQRHRWILAVLGIGVGLSLLVRSVSSTRADNLVVGLLGVMSLTAVAWLIGLGPVRRTQRPLHSAAEAIPHMSDSDAESPVDQLVRLGQLRAAGGVTQDEFEVQKKRILDLPPNGRS